MARFIYMLLGIVASPFLMEWVKSRVTYGPAVNIIKGVPAYLVSVVVCTVVAIVVCVLPGGWEMSFWNVAILTCVIYFGNQFFYNLIVKPLIRKVAN